MIPIIGGPHGGTYYNPTNQPVHGQPVFLGLSSTETRYEYAIYDNPQAGRLHRRVTVVFTSRAHRRPQADPRSKYMGQ